MSTVAQESTRQLLERELDSIGEAMGRIMLQGAEASGRERLVLARFLGKTADALLELHDELDVLKIGDNAVPISTNGHGSINGHAEIEEGTASNVFDDYLPSTITANGVDVMGSVAVEDVSIATKEPEPEPITTEAPEDLTTVIDEPSPAQAQDASELEEVVADNPVDNAIEEEQEDEAEEALDDTQASSNEVVPTDTEVQTTPKVLNGRTVERFPEQAIDRLNRTRRPTYKFDRATKIVIADNKVILVDGKENKLRVPTDGSPAATMLLINVVLEAAMTNSDKLTLADIKKIVASSGVSAEALSQAVNRFLKTGLLVRRGKKNGIETLIGLPEYVHVTDKRPEQDKSPDFLADAPGKKGGTRSRSKDKKSTPSQQTKGTNKKLVSVAETPTLPRHGEDREIAKAVMDYILGSSPELTIIVDDLTDLSPVYAGMRVAMHTKALYMQAGCSGRLSEVSAMIKRAENNDEKRTAQTAYIRSRQGGLAGFEGQANCLGVDPELFFPERGASTREAKGVCRGCVVREDCLERALVESEKFGIWGGLSERERRRIRRQRTLARATGTSALKMTS